MGHANVVGTARRKPVFGVLTRVSEDAPPVSSTALWPSTPSRLLKHGRLSIRWRELEQECGHVVERSVARPGHGI